MKKYNKLIEDFIGDSEERRRMVENGKVFLARQWGSRIMMMSEVVPKQVEWLWKPYIPLGKLTILRGDPGCGKTSFALAIAAIVSRGGDFPGTNPFENKKTEARKVLFFTAEDDLDDSVAPRLIAAGADMDYVLSVRDDVAAPQMTFVCEEFEELIKTSEAALVVCDPIQAFLGAGVDAHRANEVRPVMTHLRNLARTYNCAIVLIEHLNKNSGGRPLYRGLGSIDTTAAARSILMLGCDENNPQEKGAAHIKTNCGVLGDIIGFTIDENGFKWNPNSTISKNEIFGNTRTAAETGGQSALERAMEFLEEVLSEDKRTSKDLRIMAQAYGISDATLRRAREKMGIDVSEREGHGATTVTYWKLPSKNLNCS